MKELKMKSFKSVVLLIVLVWVIAVITGMKGFPSLFTSMKEPISWDDVDFSGDI